VALYLLRGLNKRVAQKGDVNMSYPANMFAPLDSFESVKTRAKSTTRVFVGRGPLGDARDCRLSPEMTVLHNRSYTWTCHHPRGYLVMSDRSIFDRQARTIAGEPAFIFLATDKLRLLWKAQNERDAILARASQLADPDFIALGELVAGLVEPSWPHWIKSRNLSERALDLYLPHAGLPLLRSITMMLGVSAIEDAARKSAA
jgi:hypothetical protein